MMKSRIAGLLVLILFAIGIVGCKANERAEFNEDAKKTSGKICKEFNQYAGWVELGVNVALTTEYEARHGTLDGIAGIRALCALRDEIVERRDED